MTTEPTQPALVLLHFFGNSQLEWRRVLPAFSDRKCLTMDMPGFGDSAALGARDIAAMADYVDARICNEKITRCVLVGHSMTGKVAAVLASRHPDYLIGLVLVTPSPPAPEPFSDKVRKQLLGYDGSREAAADYVDGITVKRLADEWREHAIADAMRASIDAWKTWIGSGSQEDWSDRVGQLAIPALVIAGEGDPSLNESYQRRLTMPHLPNGTLEVIGGGHILPLENPEALITAIRNFIQPLSR